MNSIRFLACNYTQFINPLRSTGLNNVKSSLVKSLPNYRLYSTETVEKHEEPDKLFKYVELELKGNDPAVLRSYSKFAVTAGNHLDIKSTSWTNRKPHHERFTVLKVAHIFKKHRVQYEFRTYFAFVQYKYLTGSTADTLLEYIQRNLPEGVAMKTTKVEIQELPDFLGKDESK